MGAGCQGNQPVIVVVIVVQLPSHVRLFVAPWTAAHQASLSFTVSWNLLKLMSIELSVPSNHLILCHALLLLPSLLPSIKVFSNESALHIRWPRYWSFSFSISPSNEYSGLISFRMDWLDTCSGLNGGCSLAQLCPTLCITVDCSTPGFPVIHCLLEFAQTHVH